MVADLEIGLIGTPADLDQAAAVLATTGRIAGQGTRRSLTGEDAGRARLYLRITVAARHNTAPQPRTRRQPAGTLDLTA